MGLWVDIKQQIILLTKIILGEVFALIAALCLFFIIYIIDRILIFFGDEIINHIILTTAHIATVVSFIVLSIYFQAENIILLYQKLKSVNIEDLLNMGENGGV